MYPSKHNVQVVFAIMHTAFHPPPEGSCTLGGQNGHCSIRDQRWLTYAQPFLPVSFRPISAGLTVLPFQLEGGGEKHLGPFPCFSRARTCRPAEKSNYNLFSWWNSMTASPMVKANPSNTKKEAKQRGFKQGCACVLPSLLGNYAERLQ